MFGVGDVSLHDSMHWNHWMVSCYETTLLRSIGPVETFLGMQNVTRTQSSPPGLLHLIRGSLLTSINLHVPVLLEGGAIPLSIQNQINKIHASLF